MKRTRRGQHTSVGRESGGRRGEGEKGDMGMANGGAGQRGGGQKGWRNTKRKWQWENKSPTQNTLWQGGPLALGGGLSPPHLGAHNHVRWRKGSPLSQPCIIYGATTGKKLKKEIKGEKDGERKRRLRTTSNAWLGLASTSKCKQHDSSVIRDLRLN